MLRKVFENMYILQKVIWRVCNKLTQILFASYISKSMVASSCYCYYSEDGGREAVVVKSSVEITSSVRVGAGEISVVCACSLIHRKELLGSI